LVQYNPNTNLWRYWGYGSTANNWPSLIPYTSSVSIQRKSSGGYIVWIGYESTAVIIFDSDTQLFTQLPNNGNTGDVIGLPGTDCVDDLQNIWAIRISSPGFYSLDYRTQSGNWVTPVQPPVPNVIFDIWTFKAYGNNNALLVDGNSVVWKFNGSGWQNLGSWRDGAFTSGIDIDDQGNIWVTGIEGAARRDAQSGSWQRYRVTNSSQIDYWVRDISIDNSGNVWMTGNAGGGVGGFQKFDGTRWIGFNQYNYGLGYPFPFPADNTDVICFRSSNGNIVINPMFNFLHSWNGINYSSLNYPFSVSKGIVEDSQNRLWSLGEYYNLHYLSGSLWISVPFDGWGANLAKDPTRPGTIWACSGNQVLRTDGVYNFTRYNTDFPELDPQSDLLTTVAPDANGIAWVGSNKGLFKLNANTGTYQFFSPSNSQIPGNNIRPLIVTPDGRLWFSNFQSTTTTTYGLCWFDGTNFGIFPQQQTGGLPHAQIYDVEVKNIPNGYELWISCASRGIAVLTVTGTVIPVELKSFTATLLDNKVHLNWTTATELNNKGFEIERKVLSSQSSFGNSEFQTIGFVEGNGTTTEIKNYSFTDNLTLSHTLTHTLVYRLKQIDFDGSYSYSNEIEVKIDFNPKEFVLYQNYPNPFNPSTKISWQSPVGSWQTLKIYDALGNEVTTLVDEYREAGRYEVEFQSTVGNRQLASGIYFYTIKSGDYFEVKRMTLLK
jgi:streptogramin lyase